MGYATVAFGLRIRAPLLRQVVRNTSKTPYQASAEGRTLGNAEGQSWCLLNSRAMSAIMVRVRASEFRHRIHPVMQIHDANYFLADMDLEVIAFLNRVVTEEVRWQDDPAIWHDKVKLGGKLGLFWPDWSQECELPIGATQAQIRDACKAHIDNLKEKKNG